MQVKETVAEGLKHEFQISVPAADLDAKADARLVDLKDKVRLNGFRPGKVPVSHLKKVYGRSVMAETIDQTIRDTNSQIFTERGFRLATEPKVTMPTEQKEVEDILAGKSDLTYTVAIEVVPAIQLADFKSFAVEKPVAEVTDVEVDDAIKRIAEQNRTFAAKGEGAKAETGDRVTVSFDCRYAGQSHELTVASIVAFSEDHARRRGYALAGSPVEVIALRVSAQVDSPVVTAELPAPTRRGPVRGPAVIAEGDCTVWVAPGWRAAVHPGGAWILERGG